MLDELFKNYDEMLNHENNLKLPHKISSAMVYKRKIKLENCFEQNSAVNLQFVVTLERTQKGFEYI